MLIDIFRTPGDFRIKITRFIFIAVIVVFSLTIHEVSHGLTALALGDDTAKRRGRLTLNPLRHLNPIGTVMMLLVGFGYAEPVPINPNNFKNRKLGMAITALAGPISNLLLSFIAGFGVVGVLNSGKIIETSEGFGYLSVPYLLIYIFCSYMHTMNLYLAVFNLIPIPPLDGSRILNIFLPERYYFSVMRYEKYIALGLVVLLYFGVLTGPLSVVTGTISNGILRLVDLII